MPRRPQSKPTGAAAAQARRPHPAWQRCALACAIAVQTGGLAAPARADERQPPAVPAAEPATPTCNDRANAALAEAARLTNERKRLDVEVLLAGLAVSAVGLAIYQLSTTEEAALYDRYRQRDESGRITGVTYGDASAMATRISAEQTLGAVATCVGFATVGVALTLLVYEGQPLRRQSGQRVSLGPTGLRLAF